MLLHLSEEREAHKRKITSCKINTLDPRDEIKLKKGEPVEEVESIIINKDELEKIVQISFALRAEIREE